MIMQFQFIRDNSRITQLFLLLWVVLVMAADLKITLFSKIHWVASFFLLAPVVWLNIKNKVNNNLAPYTLIFSVLLILSVLISSFFSLNYLYDLYQAGKLFIIIFLCYWFFIHRPQLAHFAFNGFVISTYINFFVLIIGVLFSTQIASIMTLDGRWGTLLNYPGSLSKVGVVVYVYAGYLLFVRSAFSIGNTLLLLASVSVVYFDGSRTSELSLLIGTLFLFIILFIEYRKKIFKPRISSMAVALLLLTLVFIVSTISVDKITLSIETKRAIEQAKIEQARTLEQTKSAQQTPPYQMYNADQTKQATVPKNTVPVEVPLTDELKQSNNRIESMFANIGASGILVGLASSDPIRFQMVITALNEIVSHPVFGKGISYTKYQTKTGPIVIHNTYLQIWADLGILGLLAFLGLYFGWIVRLPVALRQIQNETNIKLRAVYYNAIFLLVYLSFSALFHPLSTEWSEWVIFIVPSAIYWSLLRRNEGELNHE
jgi:O-antigen ligase